MNIVVYISGHGFGHLAQMAPVLNRMHQRSPACRFLIRCSLPEAEIRARLDFDFALDGESVDLGVIQKSAIEEDREASIEQMSVWCMSMPERIQREVNLLRSFQPALVISNISPLAFPAARALAVANIGLATLDWHTIYGHWLDAKHPVMQHLKAAYQQCDLLLTPPMAMDMAVFIRQQSIPLIAAKPKIISCPFASTYARSALVVFGGSSQPAFDLQALAAMPDWQFLIPHAPHDAPQNVTPISFDGGLMPVDLMPFVDVVVCKPGYGVLAECWRTGRPMAWVERPDFPEYPMLKRWLDDQFPSHCISRAAFQQSDWSVALQGALTSQRRFPELQEDGADRAAEFMLARLQV